MSTYKLYKVEMPGEYIAALVRDDSAVAFTSWRPGQSEEDKVHLARRLHGAYSYISLRHLDDLGRRELIDTFER